jgi:hypothetical protein
MNRDCLLQHLSLLVSLPGPDNILGYREILT